MVLAEWDEYAPRMAAILRDPRRLQPRSHSSGARRLVDLVVHQGDLTHAVDAPAVEDPDVIDAPLVGRRALLASSLEVLELPAIELICADGHRRARRRRAYPRSSVRASRRDLWRSLHGRRTPEQVRSFDWDGDPTPYLDLWPGLAFSFPSVEVESNA